MKQFPLQEESGEDRQEATSNLLVFASNLLAVSWGGPRVPGLGRGDWFTEHGFGSRRTTSFTILDSTLLYSTLLCVTLLYFTLLDFTFTLLYFTLLYSALLYFTLLYSTLGG